MVKKGKIKLSVETLQKILLIALIIATTLWIIQNVSADNLIFGNPIPEAERLNSINVTSNDFRYSVGDYVKVSTYNSNGSLIDVDNITIELINAKNNIDYEATPISQDLNGIYKRGFTIENENITSLDFKITAIKGDKTITQDYTTTISNSENSQFKDKVISSLNIIGEMIVNNWLIIVLVIAGLFMMIFIIKGVNYLTK